MLDGNIHADGNIRPAILCGIFQKLRRFAEYAHVDLVDQTCFLRNRNKFHGADKLPVRILHPRKRLKTAQFMRNIILRLQVEKDGIRLQGLADFTLNFECFLRFKKCIGIADDNAFTVFSLGVMQGKRSLCNQIFQNGGIVRILRITETCSHIVIIIVNRDLAFQFRFIGLNGL